MYPPDCILAHNPARPCRPKGGFGLVMMMMRTKFPTFASVSGTGINRIPLDLFKFRPRVRPSVSSMHTTLPPHQLRLIHILPLLGAGFESCFLSQPILTFDFLPIINCVLFSSTPTSWSHQTHQSMDLHPTLNKPGDLSCLIFS